jgi:hypothetical protein
MRKVKSNCRGSWKGKIDPLALVVLEYSYCSAKLDQNNSKTLNKLISFNILICVEK